jgi:hypothetical protein
MGLSFRKSIKLNKNSRLNISKSGLGISTGIKGLRIGISLKGIRLSSTRKGFSYQKTIGWKKVLKFLSERNRR